MNRLLICLVHVWQLALYLAVISGTIFWHIGLNLFSWSPELDLQAIACPVAVIVFSVLVYINSPKVNRKYGLALNFLMCAFVLVYGYGAFSEKVSGVGWFRRSVLSPLWFKTSQIIMLLLPVVVSMTALETRKPSSAKN